MGAFHVCTDGSKSRKASHMFLKRNGSILTWLNFWFAKNTWFLKVISVLNDLSFLGGIQSSIGETLERMDMDWHKTCNTWSQSYEKKLLKHTPWNKEKNDENTSKNQTSWW